MLAERARQDAGIFTVPTLVPQPQQKSEPLQSKLVIQQPTLSNQTYYSLSDSNMKS
jgi:hypothetical protein